MFCPFSVLQCLNKHSYYNIIHSVFNVCQVLLVVCLTERIIFVYWWCMWTMWLQNVSRRSLGKILLSTLESCSDPHHGTFPNPLSLSVISKISEFIQPDHELPSCFFSTQGRLIFWRCWMLFVMNWLHVRFSQAVEHQRTHRVTLHSLTPFSSPAEQLAKPWRTSFCRDAFTLCTLCLVFCN